MGGGWVGGWGAERKAQKEKKRTEKVCILCLSTCYIVLWWYMHIVSVDLLYSVAVVYAYCVCRLAI